MRAMVPFALVAAVFAITLLVSAGLCHAGLMDAGTCFWMGTVRIRGSDDVPHYDCTNAAGLTAKGDIPGRMGGGTVAGAVFLDFGIVDSIWLWRSPPRFAVTQTGSRAIRHGRGGFWSVLYSAPKSFRSPRVP